MSCLFRIMAGLMKKVKKLRGKTVLLLYGLSLDIGFLIEDFDYYKGCLVDIASLRFSTEIDAIYDTK